MNARDRIKLLFGPYQAAALRTGDRASCLYRDRDVKIIGWTDARIPWPLCRALDVRGGGHGLLVEEELARAIRQESAAAIEHWWGVCPHTVWRWRKAFGVGLMDSPGSRRLVLDVCTKNTATIRGKRLPPEACEQRRRNAIENNLAQYLRPGYHGPRWAEAELALLGTMPDEEVATRIGKTPNGVRLKRQKLGIARYQPPGVPDHYWSEEELALLGTATDEEVARRLGRTKGAVIQKRWELGIPCRDARRRENRG